MHPAWPSDLLPAPFAGGARPEQLDAYSDLIGTSLEQARDSGLRDLVLLLDGVGSELLEDHRALTPTFRALAGDLRHLRTVAPSTTATAMVSLHTGREPLATGIMGYRTLDPASGASVHQLAGAEGINPQEWMPLPGLAERTDRPCVQVAPKRHAGSFLSGVAYRSWRFHPHGREDRVEQALQALRRIGPGGLVHLHVDDVDHVGHTSAVDSDQWRAALAEVDSLVGTVLRRAPRGTRITVTADHGMVDTDEQHVVDLSADSVLDGMIAAVAGEPRSVVVVAAEGTDPADLALRAQEFLGERGFALTREQAFASGLWGPTGQVPDARVAGRLGDVVLLMRGHWTAEVSRLRPPGDRHLLGVHGSLTAAESIVPLLRIEV